MYICIYTRRSAWKQLRFRTPTIIVKHIYLDMTLSTGRQSDTAFQCVPRMCPLLSPVPFAAAFTLTTLFNQVPTEGRMANLSKEERSKQSRHDMPLCGSHGLLLL